MHRTAQILARGDPGFFDFIKKVGKVGTNIASRLFQSSPVGIAASVIGQTFAPRAPSSRPLPQMRQLHPAVVPLSVAAIGAVGGIVEARLAAGGGAGGIQPVGTHLNKSSYFLRDGTFVPARSRYVRNRTRNNANGRALRRAIGRAKGFDNLVKRNRKALRSLSRI